MPASPRTWCAEPSESADANLEQPEKRQFKKRPLGLIQANRGTYIAAALTISLAYLATPRSLGLAPLASFEEWCRAVREPLVWVDCGDPVASQEKLRTEDPRMIEKTAIFEAWKARIGVGAHRACYTKELIATAGSDDALFEALLAVAAQRFTQERKIDPKALGKWLAKQEGSIAARLS